MTRKEWEALVEYTLNIGRQMLECGAEAWRAENTMARILRAYGLEVQDAHVIATQAAVTVKTPEGDHYTSTCMILPEKTGTDLERLEILNAAARRICEATPALDQLPLVLQRPAVRWSWREFLGYMLGAGAFGVGAATRNFWPPRGGTTSSTPAASRWPNPPRPFPPQRAAPLG